MNFLDPILEATETTWIQGPLANHQVGTAESGPTFRCCLGRGCGDGSARWTGKLSQHLATGGPGWPHLSNDPCVWCLVGWKFCKIWMMPRQWDPFNWMIINFCLFLSISATSMPSREWEADLNSCNSESPKTFKLWKWGIWSFSYPGHVTCFQQNWVSSHLPSGHVLYRWRTCWVWWH